MEATAALASPQSLTSAVLRRYLFSSPDPSCRGGSGEVSDPAWVGRVAGLDPLVVDFGFLTEVKLALYPLRAKHTSANT